MLFRCAGDERREAEMKRAFGFEEMILGKVSTLGAYSYIDSC